MSTLRVSNIEAKAFPSSPTVDEKVKVTNSSGDILLHLDGTTSGIGSIGIGTTGTTFRVDPNQTVTFPGTIISSGIITAASFSGPITGTTGTFGGNVTISGNLGVAGTITYEDVARVDATGISTFREGFGVGPLTGIALTAYKDGSIRSTGIITATTLSGTLNSSNLTGALPALDGSALTGVGASFANSSVNSTGIATFSAFVPTESQLSHRNIIINGNMAVSQRNGGTEVNPVVHATCITDRYKFDLSQTSKIKAQQVADGPTGFMKSLKVTSLAATTPGASDYYLVQQHIEGLNTDHLGWGAAGAKTVTLSFWVKSSLTGTFAACIRNNAYDRTNVQTYTISSAGTWERKTITFTGDTSGTWLTTTGKGLSVGWDFGGGTNFDAASTGTWLGTNDFTTSSCTHLVSTNAATWQLTGVQLEVGSVATPFEHKSYQDELARCQRYYFRDLDTDGTTDLSPGVYACTYQNNHKIAMIWLPVPMRITPTMTATWVNGTYNVAKSSNTRMEGYFSSSNTSNSPIHSTSIKCEAEL